jgi:hypothetical protein
MFDATHCFVSYGRGSIIDVCRADGLSWFDGLSLDDMKHRYPDAEHVTIDEAAQQLERRRLERHGAPEPISQEDFIAALEVLPPREWHRSCETESFKCEEALSGRITATYVRIGTRYYKLCAVYGTPHADLVRKCLGAAAPA